MLAAVFAAGLLVAATSPAAQGADTVVSLTFDEGQCTQYDYLRPVLQQHPSRATFFVNSNDTGTPGSPGFGMRCRMTWAQIGQLHADGHEIGGHTLDNVDLTQVTQAQAQHQACTDRSNLAARGFDVTSFAYPAGANNASVRSIVQGCGYTAARTLETLQPPPSGTPFRETQPPGNPYAMLATESISGIFTLQQLQAYVTRVEAAGGGWIPFVFHRVCPLACDISDAPTPETIDQFLTWLEGRGSQGTVVRTIHDAMAAGQGPDTTPPSSSIACNGTGCSSGWYGGSVSVTLSATDSQSGVDVIRYTTDGSDPTASSAAYTGAFSVSSPGTTAVKYRAWDNAGNVEPVRSQAIRIDTTAPASAIQCNGSACSTGAYTAPVSVTLSAADSQSGVDVIRYTTNGSDPTASSPAYTGAFTISAGGTTTVKYRAFDNAGNAEPVRSQAVQVNLPAGGQTVVSLTFDDGHCSQYDHLRAVLLAHPSRATFYINSADTGTPGNRGFGMRCRMTWAQITQLWADGNEIGGHRLVHPNLSQLSTAQIQNQVCTDRSNLNARGFNATSFAYPFGANNATVRSIVQSCGYTSARTYETLQPPPSGNPFRELLPPTNPFGVLGSRNIDAVVTLSQLQSYVTRVENAGGGWIPFVFHRVCPTSCDIADAPTPETLSAFLTWLEARASQGTVVRTVRQAMGG